MSRPLSRSLQVSFGPPLRPQAIVSVVSFTALLPPFRIQLGHLVMGILRMWPNHLSVPVLISLTMSEHQDMCENSKLVRIVHSPLLQTGPKIVGL